MHIIRATNDPKNNRKETHLGTGQTLLILTIEDLNSNGDRFRGQAADVVMVPQYLEKVYMHFPAWKVVEPVFKQNSIIKFY